MSKPNVLVIGSGGVGAIAAYALSLNGGANVTAAVRSDYKKVSAEGYSFDSSNYGKFAGWKPDNVASSVSGATEFGPFDFIVVTTKNTPDGPLTCEQIIEPVVSEKSVIVLLQNGIGMDEPMFKAYPNNVVLSGITLIGSTNIDCHIHAPGYDIVSVGHFKHPTIPEDQQVAAAKRFISLYENGKNKITYDEDVATARWTKLVYNAAINTTTALVDLDVSRCQLSGSNEAVFRPAMKEIYKIAASEGCIIDPTIEDRFIHIGDGLFYTPSMLIDSRKDRLMELEVILGNPLKIAARNGVDAPVLSMLYSLLKMVQFRIMEKSGLVTVDDTIDKSKTKENYESAGKKSDE